MAHDDQFKVILFDLGGVLLNLNDPIKIFGLWASSRSARHCMSAAF